MSVEVPSLDPNNPAAQQSLSTMTGGFTTMETYDTVGTALDRTHDTMPSGAADRAHSNMPAGPGERQRSGGAPRPVSGREDEILGQLRQESSAMQVRGLQHLSLIHI